MFLNVYGGVWMFDFRLWIADFRFIKGTRDAWKGRGTFGFVEVAAIVWMVRGSLYLINRFRRMNLC